MTKGTQRRAHSKAQRRGFTLLEVMLATAISALLLFALYVAFNVQLRHVDVGREVVEESAVARAVLARIASDITASLPPVVPAKSSKGTASSQTSGSTSEGSSSTSTAQPNSTSTAQGSSTTTTQGSGSSTVQGSSSGAVQFNLGVQGDQNRLMLFISRVPRELSGTPGGEAGPLVSDLRRISYWLGGSGGLWRQELKLVTSDDAANAAPEEGDDAAKVMAEEVKSLEFRYFDGTAWQDVWDGTKKGGASSAAVGPPLAIEIKIGIARAARPSPAGAPEMPEAPVKYYRHVVAIPTANGITTNQP